MQIIFLDTSIYFLLNAIREVYAPLMHYNGDPDYYLELLLESGFFKHVMKAVLKSVASGDDLGPGLFENLDLADPSTKIEDTTTY
ncbi:hypothetical protein F4801DRAFT_540991 [Xylaria longipes]|nr:hypothetical protein F4801DRAFT_540991 [Xylaria longipes]